MNNFKVLVNHPDIDLKEKPYVFTIKDGLNNIGAIEIASKGIKWKPKDGHGDTLIPWSKINEFMELIDKMDKKNSRKRM